MNPRQSAHSENPTGTARTRFAVVLIVLMSLIAAACGGGTSLSSTTDGGGDGAVDDGGSNGDNADDDSADDSGAVAVPIDDGADNTSDDDSTSDDSSGSDDDGSDVPVGDSGVAALAGQILDGCEALDTDALAGALGESVIVESSDSPASPYRSCTVLAAEDPEVALAYVNVAPDLDGENFRITFADYDNLTPLPQLGPNAGYNDDSNFFTGVRVIDGDAEFVMEARTRTGELSFEVADAEAMAEIIPTLVANMAPKDDLDFDLPDGIEGCDDLPVSEVAGDSLGDWTSGSFDGMLSCRAVTDTDTELTVILGSRGSVEDAVDWVHQKTDDILLDGSLTYLYPIAEWSDWIDRGFSVFTVRILTDYADILEGEDQKADMAVASRGEYVLSVSLTGPIVDDEELLSDDMGFLVEEFFGGIDSDYDNADYVEDIDQVAADYLAGDLPSADVATEVSVCDRVEDGAVAEIAEIATIDLPVMASDRGFLDDDDTVVNCPFWEQDGSGEADIGLGRTPLDLEFWNGDGDVPWIDWQIEDMETFEDQGATIGFYGPDFETSALRYIDDAGFEVFIEMDSPRTNPVTLSEMLSILDLVLEAA